ncbi:MULTISPECIES: hypothetical protein [Aminobacterium]|jgi:hypothetical protein|uniref:hypothetical protein n=1 Tax=Aminobacterium TaxID=81466 RepID=UPI0025796D71|nr:MULTISPECIES: hypothetical protein [unclassified Aminobacterium]
MAYQFLSIAPCVVDDINNFLSDPRNDAVSDLSRVVAKYGTVDEINKKAHEAGKVENHMKKLERIRSPYIKDLEWLQNAKDSGSFISLSEYRSRVAPDRPIWDYDETKAPTLEISALQYFPWLVAEVKQAIEKGEVLPGRFIRERKMKEQEAENEDLPAVRAAIKILGASCVETLDTKGTDGSNIHLGGPSTITGYFGGIGQPNSHPLRWIDEFLYYYVNYGVDEVLNINPGTVFLGYLLYRLGVNIKFKISVFMGNDNPYAVLWTLLAARLFAREDGSTPLAGFNLSNSIDAEHLAQAAAIRKELKLENQVRIEHHITETWKSIVQQPYNRRDDLLELVKTIPNISAKHEGGNPEDEQQLAHPSDILDYFRDKKEIEASGDWDALSRNYLLKHKAVNSTAEALTKAGFSFIAAGVHRL